MDKISEQKLDWKPKYFIMHSKSKRSWNFKHQTTDPNMPHGYE